MVSEVVLHAGGHRALLLLGLLGAALQRTSPKSYLAVHSCEDLNCGEKKKQRQLGGRWADWKVRVQHREYLKHLD